MKGSVVIRHRTVKAASCLETGFAGQEADKKEKKPRLSFFFISFDNNANKVLHKGGTKGCFGKCGNDAVRPVN